MKKEMENINNYRKFKEDDKIKSDLLRDAFDLSQNDVIVIDNWFELYLDKHFQAKDFKDGLAYEKELSDLHNSILELTSPVLRKYILAKLIKYLNISSGGFLKPLLVARLKNILNTLIIRYINESDTRYAPSEFIPTTSYLKDNFLISPNGELIENILKINTKHRITAKAIGEEKQNIIANILHIIADKGFHHDIICFKKVLMLIDTADIDLMERIKNFEVKNKQGSYFMIQMVFNMRLPIDDLGEDFEAKRELIFLFDSAAGANPKQNWIDKMSALIAKTGLSSLLLICDKIIENEHFKNYHFNDSQYWGDDISKRFIKSAQWTKERCSMTC